MLLTSVQNIRIHRNTLKKYIQLKMCTLNMNKYNNCCYNINKLKKNLICRTIVIK